jgi:hypothetical protein
MSKYCPNCGAEISEIVKFCESCGAKIESFSLKEDKKSTVEGTSGNVNPKRDSSSLPLAECFFCGVETSKIFYCPLCGHDFCSIHKLHQNHFRKADKPTEQQKSGNSNKTVKPSKGNNNRHIMVAVYVIVAIIVGIVFSIGILLYAAGSDSTNLPITVGCVTESNSATTTLPQKSIMTAPPTLIQQYVTVATPIKPITINTPVSISPRPTIVKIKFPQPLTGTIIKGNVLSGGDGELTIDNINGGSDAIAYLTYNGRKDSLIGVFIRKGTTYTINNIRDGNYDLYILYGENWNPNTRKFEDYMQYTKFEDPFPYQTSNNMYRIWEVTLYTVINGNANTEVLSKDNFPEI